MELVLVEWVDSHSGHKWQPLEDLKSTAHLLHCRSVGWLVSDNKDCKVLASSISGEKNGNVVICGCGDIVIPKKSILKTTFLKKK